MIKIVFTDVDGTLFDSNNALNETVRSACIKAQAKNIPVVITTGRQGDNAIRVGEMIEAKQYNGYIIGNDGTEIWSYQAQKWIYLEQLDSNLSKKLYNFLVKYHDKFILHFNSTDTLYVNHIYNKWSQWVENLQINIVKLNHERDLKQPISRIMVILDKYWNVDQIKAFVETFENNFPDLTIVQYHTNVFTISKKDISKGSAVLWLCNYLNLDVAHALTIGDSFNDLPMFEVAGFPIVMKNSHDAIKPYGKIIAPSNDEQGVAYVINNYVLKNNK